MSIKIGEIHITCYDDGTRVMDAGFYPSLEDMAHDVGDLICEQIPKVIPGDGSWKIANERRDCAHKLVQHFAANPAQFLYALAAQQFQHSGLRVAPCSVRRHGQRKVYADRREVTVF